MSDFNQSPDVPLPPPPPPAPPQAPFGAPAGGPPPAPGYPQFGAPPPGYMPMAAVTAPKPPRPAVTVGSVLLIVGGVLSIAGAYLNWFTIEGVDYTGFSGEGGDTKDGPVFLFLGVLALGFGITQLVARRVLGVAIAAVVFASFLLLAAIADLGDVSDAMDLAETFGVEASTGPGLWIILVGAVLALGGAIATLARRRK